MAMKPQNIKALEVFFVVGGTIKKLGSSDQQALPQRSRPARADASLFVRRSSRPPSPTTTVSRDPSRCGACVGFDEHGHAVRRDDLDYGAENRRGRWRR